MRKKLFVQNIILFLSMFVMQRLVPHKGFCNAFFPLVANGPFFFRPIIYCYHMPIVTQLVTVSTISINRMSVVLSPIKATHVRVAIPIDRFPSVLGEPLHSHEHRNSSRFCSGLILRLRMEFCHRGFWQFHQ